MFPLNLQELINSFNHDITLCLNVKAVLVETLTMLAIFLIEKR